MLDEIREQPQFEWMDVRKIPTIRQTKLVRAIPLIQNSELLTGQKGRTHMPADESRELFTARTWPDRPVDYGYAERRRMKPANQPFESLVGRETGISMVKPRQKYAPFAISEASEVLATIRIRGIKQDIG
jgi:hypothetical protein